jgi:hypothetical protein
MAVTYTTATKNARMDAVAAQIDAHNGPGVLQLGTSGMGTVLAELTLNDPCASAAAGGVLSFSGFPKSDTSANASGRALAARIRDNNGGDVVTGLDVGLNSTAAPAWTGSTTYAGGVYRANGANVYKCVTGGTSASSGGPSGTGTGIADGTVSWDWYCKAGADVQLDSLEITAGQTVTINNAAITHAA